MENNRKVSFPGTQRRIASSRIEPGVSNLATTTPTLYYTKLSPSINLLITQRPLWRAKLRRERNMGAYKGLMLTKTLGSPGHVTGILQPKNEQKVDEFQPMYLCN